MKIRIEAYIRPETFNALVQLADKWDKNMSQAVNHILDAWLRQMMEKGKEQQQKIMDELAKDKKQTKLFKK